MYESEKLNKVLKSIEPVEYDSLSSRTASLFKTASQTNLSDDNDITILYTKITPIRNIHNLDRKKNIAA